ncbi:MAG TPA: YicC family protein [Deltaproteobacteria bacterium]|nr:YicC family protein [Deltaproteobacteria bacterium]
MWMSMTGFGRGDHHGGDVSVVAEIRSVNHRFLDIHVRCPAKFLSWEMRVRSMVRQVLKRGKVDVFLNIREWGKAGTAVRVNHGLLSSFLAEANRVREEYALSMDLSFRDLLGIPDIFVFAPEGNDPVEELWALGEGAVRDALSMLVGSRREEGERLRDGMERAVGKLSALAEEISVLAGENKELARARFRERIEALSGEAGIDPARVQQEAAFLIDRLDISEESDRLRSHLSGMLGLMAGEDEAVGKRFDFLVQEAFRELNTTSSKAAHAGISERVVVAKTELEKIREQIQNVE